MSGTQRVRTPTRLQMEAVECGAACIAIIMEAMGSYLPLEQVREACAVGRDGVKASNMVKAAKGFGLEAKGFRKNPEDLQTMEMPVILHWNFNHFVVLEGFGAKGRVYLNDPAMGPRTITHEELDQAFTGVVLTLKPGPEFVPSGRRPSVIPVIKEKLQHSHGGLWFVFLASLALTVPALVTPIFSRIFVDDILVGGKQEWLTPLLWGMVVTAVVQGLLVWLRERFLLRLQLKLAITMSSRFLWQSLHLPSRFFSQRFAGDIVSRVQINDSLAYVLSDKLIGQVLNLVVLIFYWGLMLYYDVLLALLVTVVSGLNLVAVQLVSKSRVDLSLSVQQERGKLMGMSMAGLQLIETYKASGLEDDFYSGWAGQYAKVVNNNQKLAYLSTLMSAVPRLIFQLTTVAVLVFGALRVVQGHLTPGMLVAFQAIMMGFVGPLGSLVDFVGFWQSFQGDMNRLDDVMATPVDPNTQDTTPLEEGQSVQLTGTLAVSGLTFGYSALGAPLIHDLSFSIQPGQRVALVGGSGSGKSTVAKIVAGLYDPWEGDILFDGHSRKEWPRAVMTQSVAMVDQEVMIFEGSIRDNLSLWNSTVREEAIVQAAKDACIHDDIAVLADGYDSKMGEGGGNFSGGQRQRLEIARALVGNPRLLVLDEATSALDSETERIIDANLRRRGCACLLIAHRLSTIRDCDEIIVLERGQVVERGRHEDLLQNDGYYASLIRTTS